MRTEDKPPLSTVHSTNRQNAKIRIEKTKDEFTLLNKRLQELKEDFETTETKVVLRPEAEQGGHHGR